MSTFSRRTFNGLLLATAIAFSAGSAHAQAVKEIRLDFATYNPVSLLLKERGLLEKEFAADGISSRWAPTRRWSS
jgi:sulfonate transport system substrate-binding protein